MPKDYLIRHASEIRRRVSSDGLEIDRPGWAMGPFYTSAELPFSRNFEVKEWDSEIIQTGWRNHESNGPEYISVTRGRLTVIGGVVIAGGKSIVEQERIELKGGTCIVLRPGYFRRFESSSDACGLTVRAPGTDRTVAVAGSEAMQAHLERRYGALTEHWKHTDQVRQLLLYNFLMAGTILAAGWGVFYGMDDRPVLLLKSLSVIGVVLSLWWTMVALRSTGYYEMYETEARELESTFPDPDLWPFRKRERFRSELRWPFRMPAIVVTAGVPLLFLVFFAMSCAYAF